MHTPYSFDARRRARGPTGSGRRDTRFVRLWMSVVSANLADGILRVTLPLLAISIGATPLGVSFVVAGSSLPWLLGTMPAGVLADRVNRSIVIRTSAAVRVVATISLISVIHSDSTSIAVLTGLAMVFGGAEVAADVSSQTEVASIVESERLETAYGRLTSGLFAAELLIGPAVAGVAFQWDPTVAIAIATASFVVAGVVLAPSHSESLREEASNRWWVDAFAGLRLLASHDWLRRTAISAGVLNFTSAGSAAVLVTYALSSDGLDLSERDFGFFLTAMGIGGVLGGLVASRIHRLLGDRRSLLVGVFGFVAVDVAPGLITNPPALAVASALGVALGMVYSTKVIALRQRILHDRIRGRVNAASQLVSTGAAPVGAILAGVSATGVGFRPTFLALGIVALGGVMAAHPWAGIAGRLQPCLNPE